MLADFTRNKNMFNLERTIIAVWRCAFSWSEMSKEEVGVGTASKSISWNIFDIGTFAEAYMDLGVRKRLFKLITQSLTYLQKPKFEKKKIFCGVYCID